MRQLYVTSNCPVPTLIGILSEIKPGSKDPYGQRGEYSFEYKIDKANLKIEYFPNISKTYTGFSVLKWLSNFLPSVNSKQFFKVLLDSVGLSEYDEWEWLKSFGKVNVNTNALLFEELPEGTIRYDIDTINCKGDGQL
jgi:hypothetical protein